MKASILDLRYKMKDVLKALDRNETVEVFYHGKPKGKIMPVKAKQKIQCKNHPLFGMSIDEQVSVDEQMNKLRGDRFSDI